MNSEQVTYPGHIVVIGGGRWARVLTEALHSAIPSSSKISVYTAHNADMMSSWVESKRFNKSIRVIPEWPSFDKAESTAAIVVNSARDHESVIRQLLSAQVPVLSEKPVTLTAKSTQALIELAHTNKTYFAAAHIFLFANYIEIFSGVLAKTNNIMDVSVSWIDPGSEKRYGESKQFDPGLSIIADWYPHILSILSVLIPGYSCGAQTLDIKSGGAAVEVDIVHGGIPCHLQMARNGRCRQRVIEINKSDGTLQLDFSTEPGRIKINNKELPAIASQGGIDRPSVKMLRTFLQDVAGKLRDYRLDIQRALYANYAIDQAMKSYRQQQANWIMDKYRSRSTMGQDLKYALAEILQKDGLISGTELNNKLCQLQNIFYSPNDNSLLIQTWLESDSPT